MRRVTLRLPPEQLADLEKLHPGLKNRTYRPTSLADPNYNCLSWSVNRDDLALWPGGEPARPRNNTTATKLYWPHKYAHSDELTAIKLFLADHGYAPATGGALVAGIEKVAVYIRREQTTRRRGQETRVDVAEDPFHLAIQREDGWWASKMGEAADIEHPSAEELLYLDDDPNGTILREWVLFFERPRRPVAWCSRVLLP